MKTLLNSKKAPLLAVCLTCLLVAACSQGPDFTQKNVISEKVLSGAAAEYRIKGSKGIRGEGTGEIWFKAPIEFANVGDTIIFDNGTIRASSN